MQRITVGILFSDAVDFSKLTEEQQQKFSETILGDLSRHAVDRLPDHIIDRKTEGDSIKLISTDPFQLARLALRLRDFYKDEEWRTLGIELDLSVRIALHVGIISQHTDPILNQDGVFGTELTVPARIEPITPPNTIYTTEQFKVLIDDPAIEFDDLGNVPLAKGAG